jgi:hypothetical protein
MATANSTVRLVHPRVRVGADHREKLLAFRLYRRGSPGLHTRTVTTLGSSQKLRSALGAARLGFGGGRRMRLDLIRNSPPR